MNRRLNPPTAALLVAAIGAAAATGIYVANRGGDTSASAPDEADFHIACSLLDESDVDAIIGANVVDSRPDAVLLPSPEIASQCSWYPEHESRGGLTLLYVESADTAEDWSNQAVSSNFGVETVRASIPTNGEPIDGLGIEAVLLTGAVTRDGVRAPLQLAIREEQYTLKLSAGDGGTPPSREALLAAARTAVRRAADFYAATGAGDVPTLPERDVCDYATEEEIALITGVSPASIESSTQERRWLVRSCTWAAEGDPAPFVTVSVVDGNGIGDHARANGVTISSLFDDQQDEARGQPHFRQAGDLGDAAFWNQTRVAFYEDNTLITIDFRSNGRRPTAARIEEDVARLGDGILEEWRSQ